MRLLLIGDIVGKPGRQIVTQALRGLIRTEEIDLVVANAENAAAGSGLMVAGYHQLIGAGVQCITMGDHIYRRGEIIPILERNNNIVRPANFPPKSPGNDHAIVQVGQSKVAVISLLGRIYMKPVDCPFQAAERMVAKLPTDVKTILVDFDVEATADKQLMGRFLDGRVTAVLGTHTHVATADEQIFPGGTAFQCDVGMTGPYQSILGRRIDRVLQTTLTFTPTHFDVAEADPRLCGTLVDCDPATGKATAIRRLMIDEKQAQELAQT